MNITQPRRYVTYRDGYYGPTDRYATIAYEGPSLLRAARTARRESGPYGFTIMRPDNYDEDLGLDSRERDIIERVDWLEGKKRERAARALVTTPDPETGAKMEEGLS